MKEWLNQIVQICITEMEFEQKRELIQEKQMEFEQFDKDTQNAIHKLFRTGFEARDSVYILSVFLACVPESVWAEDLMRCILQEKNYTAEESIMLEYQVKSFQIGSYAERKALRRKTIDKLKYMGLYSEDYIPLALRNPKKIVIITEQIVGVNNSPTLVVYNSIYYLQQLGYEVFMFVCPSDACLEEDIWYYCRGASSLKKMHGRTVVTTFRGEKIYFSQINLCEKGCMDQYRLMIKLIREWNPLFVYQVGLVNAIGDMLTGITTVVSEMLSVKECSVSNAQIIVRMEKNERKVEEEISCNMENYQTQLWKKGHIPIVTEKSEMEISRAQLDLPESQFLLAVVGNRLDMECDMEFIDLLKKILHNNCEVGVVVIGETEILNNFFLEDDSVYFIGYQDYLQNVYDIMDLYVNPKRAGGGYSSQMALQEGLPVVTLPDGDVAHTVGETFIVSDYGEMYAVIERYIQDEAYRISQQKYALQRGRDNSKGTDYMERKIRAIKEIMELQDKGERYAQYAMSE